MHFQISLSLWELQVIKDLLCVRDIAGISSNRLLLLLITWTTNWTTNFVLTITIQMSVNIQMIIEPVAQRCSVKKVFLEISQNSQESTCTRVSFLITLLASSPATLFRKMTLVQVFSCEFCEISKTPFFIEHLWWLLL